MEDDVSFSVPMDSIAVTDTLSAEQQVLIQARLWKFLGEQTNRYTVGDSSSVPIETAQELLSSICFTLDEYFKTTGLSPKLLLTEELDGLYAGGLKVIEAEITEGRHLWKAACTSAPEIDNISYRDTLRNIGGSFKRYDYRFFAHRVPSDIDYQLCHPVPESCLGIAYICEYLRRMIAENAILHAFERNSVIRLLDCYCPGHRELLINLCEPVIANGVGLALLGQAPLPLRIAADDRQNLIRLFEPLGESQARLALTEASRRFCHAAGLSDAFTREYVARTAADLYPRIAAALPAGSLDGIFIPFA